MTFKADAEWSLAEGLAFLTNGTVDPPWDDLYYETSDDTTAEAWISKGTERVMDNLAASLNQYITIPEININGTTPVYGEVGINKTIVTVNWLWLIPPYSLCLAGTIFLFSAMYLSHQSDAPLWKSSINALFYHGIDFDLNVWTPLATIPEMNAQAAMTQARLGPVGIHERLMLERISVRRTLPHQDRDETA